MNARLCILASLFFTLSLDAKLARRKDLAVDLSQTAPLVSRIPCDGSSAPEDHPTAKATFSAGGWERSFTISVFQKGRCKVDVRIKCLDEQKEGWRDAWTVKSDAASKSDELSIRSCYTWGTAEPAQYVLSAWYQEGTANPKLPWKQTPVKKISSNPDIYEFADPQGGTGRLELTER